MKKLFITIFSTILFITSAITSYAGTGHLQDDPWASIDKITDNIFVVTSQSGGNITVAVDEKTTFIVDDQLKGKSEEIKETIKTVTDKPIEFILTTHYHFDHAGGNESFAKDNAKIIAHENVRKTLKSGTRIELFQKDIPAENYDGLPVLTFANKITLHQSNDETINMVHFPNAHTDGDSVVIFEKANVISTGDIFFNGLFPFVDIDHGGSILGTAKALKELASLGDDKTQYVPGHGKVSGKKTVIETAKMLEDFFAAVKENKDKSIDEIAKIEPIKSYGEIYSWAIIDTKKFIEIALSEINKK